MPTPCDKKIDAPLLKLREGRCARDKINLATAKQRATGVRTTPLMHPVNACSIYYTVNMGPGQMTHKKAVRATARRVMQHISVTD
jgi:hypothetical protein